MSKDLNYSPKVLDSALEEAARWAPSYVAHALHRLRRRLLRDSTSQERDLANRAQ